MPGAKFEVEQTMAPVMLGGVLQVVMKQLPSRHSLLSELEDPVGALVPAVASAPTAAELEGLVPPARAVAARPACGQR